jgi:hypothetical protein
MGWECPRRAETSSVSDVLNSDTVDAGGLLRTSSFDDPNGILTEMKWAAVVAFSTYRRRGGAMCR